MKTSSFATANSENIVSSRVYNFVMAIVLLYGFAINWWMVANIPAASISAINPWIFFIGYFVSCLVGIAIFNASTNPIVSFIGYNFIVVPFGLIINLVLAQYSTSAVVTAMQTTTIVTFGMIVMGTLFPSFFKSIGTALFVGTLVAILSEVALILITGKSSSLMDWAVAILFCGWIGYDWAIASSMPKTIDNAVDNAASLYMSIINLFLRVLGIQNDD